MNLEIIKTSSDKYCIECSNDTGKFTLSGLSFGEAKQMSRKILDSHFKIELACENFKDLFDPSLLEANLLGNGHVKPELFNLKKDRNHLPITRRKEHLEPIDN